VTLVGALRRRLDDVDRVAEWRVSRQRRPTSARWGRTFLLQHCQPRRVRGSFTLTDSRRRFVLLTTGDYMHRLRPSKIRFVEGRDVSRRGLARAAGVHCRDSQNAAGQPFTDVESTDPTRTGELPPVHEQRVDPPSHDPIRNPATNQQLNRRAIRCPANEVETRSPKAATSVRADSPKPPRSPPDSPPLPDDRAAKSAAEAEEVEHESGTPKKRRRGYGEEDPTERPPKLESKTEPMTPQRPRPPEETPPNRNIKSSQTRPAGRNSTTPSKTDSEERVGTTTWPVSELPRKQRRFDYDEQEAEARESDSFARNDLATRAGNVPGVTNPTRTRHRPIRGSNSNPVT